MALKDKNAARLSTDGAVSNIYSLRRKKRWLTAFVDKKQIYRKWSISPTGNHSGNEA